MSLIEKIDAEIAEIENEIKAYSGLNKRIASLCANSKISMANHIKQFILSEQKEPCGWCAGDYRMEFNWIDKDGNTIVTDNHEVIGGIADYCPVCGRYLNQPPTDEA